MTNAIVKLWGTEVGYVSFDERNGGPARFEYARDFLRSNIQISPVTMPLSERVYSFPTLPSETYFYLPGLLADSLPDKFGNQIFQSWLNANGRDDMNPVERLCYLGSRGMGALEYEPDIGDRFDHTAELDLESLRQVASDILAQRTAFRGRDSAMEQLLEISTSAGGARAKAIIAWNEQTGEVRSGQVQAEPGFTYWLLKFDGISNNGDKDGPDEHQHTRIELAYYYMATACGIDMTPCRIHVNDGYYHFLTQRFDRDQKTGAKIHMQSLCGLAHLDFNTPGVCSYEQAAMLAARIGCPQGDAERLFRRMIFNVLARNQDDHTKNISFLMDKQGQWRLSPAYDMSWSYKPGSKWVGAHQMTINGKRDGFTEEDYLACASKMSIRRSKAKKIISEVEAGISTWRECAERADLDPSITGRIQGTFRGVT